VVGWFSAALVLEEQGRLRSVTFTAGAAPPEQLDLLERWAGSIDLVFILAVSLLTLWRGREGSAWALCFFSSGVLVANGALGMPGPPAASVWLEPAQMLLQSLNIVALYVMADLLVGAGLSRVWRGLLRGAVAGATVVVTALRVGDYAGFVFAGVRLPEWVDGVVNALVTAWIVSPVLPLLIGYGRATPESRRRIAGSAGWC
jgi:hypothetical protein